MRCGVWGGYRLQSLCVYACVCVRMRVCVRVHVLVLVHVRVVCMCMCVSVCMCCACACARTFQQYGCDPFTINGVRVSVPMDTVTRTPLVSIGTYTLPCTGQLVTHTVLMLSHPTLTHYSS